MVMLFASAWLGLRRTERSGDVALSTIVKQNAGPFAKRAQARASRVVEGE